MTRPTLTPGPFFVSTGATTVQRRLLLVSYSFPPDPSIGALRWEKMIRTGARKGWATDVLMLDPADAEPGEEDRLRDLPPATRLYAVPLRPHPIRRIERPLLRIRRQVISRRDNRSGNTSETARSAAPIAPPGENTRSFGDRLRAWRRAELAWLHYAEWEEWSRRAAALGIELFREEAYDVIVSSGPPHMAHDAARRIGQATGRPVVMDLRDPWSAPSTEPYDMASPTWRRETARHEQRCLESATLVVANTPEIAAMLEERYPALASRLTVVMNGADQDAIASAAPVRPFGLLYTGALYAGRDPRPLLAGLRSAAETLAVGPTDLRLTFLGDTEYEGIPLQHLVDEAGVKDYVRVAARVPRAEAMKVQAESPMLIVLPQDQRECVPAKIFEYVQAPSWLLCVVPGDSATASLLRGTTADLVDPDDPDGIADAITRRYREFAAGNRPSPLNADGRFNREKQASKMYDELERLAAR